MQNDDPLDSSPAADADLILRTRSGDGQAFAELWQRHYPSGMAVARAITSSIDADDLVQESYTRIFQAIVKGGGPKGSFRAYLFTSIRNTAAAWGRSRRETAMDELETIPDPDSTDQAANDALDRGLTAQAFRSLPTRWQEVLWYTEIEQMKPAEVAPLLGMSAGSVSQLAFRAREGLREAWIQVHLRNTASDSECHWTIKHLGAYSRGNLSTRDRKRVDAHLEDCARCIIVAGEARDVSSRLVLVMLPLVLGIAGATGYAALLQGGGAPVVALAAMPSSVTGGVVAATGIPVGLEITGAPGSGGGAAGGSGGGFSGIGALVGAGSVALVVAGIVAAAAIMPGLTGSDHLASLPGSDSSEESSISSDVSPDESIDTVEKPELTVPHDASEKDKPEKSTPPAPPAEYNAGTNDSTGVDEPGEPEVATAPEERDTHDTPTEPDGPDTPTDPEEPVLPAGKPEIGEATVTVDFRTLKTHYSIPITGVSDATVRATYSDTGGTTEVLLEGVDAFARTAAEPTGRGTIELRPTLAQLCNDVPVDFAYVVGDQRGEVVSYKLSELGGFPYPGILHQLCTIDLDDTTSDTGTPVPPPASDPAISDEDVTLTEEPVAEEPVAEEPVIEETVAEEPATEEPEPGADEPAASAYESPAPAIPNVEPTPAE